MTTPTATENPQVRERPASRPQPTGPCALVIFGITGDLSRRLLLPALYNLAQQQALSNNFAVIGFASSEIAEHALRGAMVEDLRKAIGPGADDAAIDWVASRVR